jgi:hypothetical protein
MRKSPSHDKEVWMRPKLTGGVARILFVLALFVAPAALASGENQGNDSKVLTVDNPAVSCESPVAADKVEGDLGPTVEFTTDDPVDFVTVKSGNGAEVVSSSFGATGGSVTLSKDVSNYVVWTCPGGGESGEEFEPSS